MRWWLRLRHRKALAQPLIVDEDGNVHVPILLPGETSRTTLHRDGAGGLRVVAAWVEDENGRVRTRWDAPPER